MRAKLIRLLYLNDYFGGRTTIEIHYDEETVEVFVQLI